MKFYSTRNRHKRVSLREAVLQGLAPDQGLYMPLTIPRLDDQFFHDISGKSFQEISCEVAKHFLEEDVPADELKKIVEFTLPFDAPLKELEENVFVLELFHGPTLAFKDFGARFLSALLGYFVNRREKEITILVATSGDTGSAVANGFLNVPGTRVVIVYPAGKVSKMQEQQFTTLGGNTMAVELEGTFDDCQELVKRAFLDEELKAVRTLTSANSINIARLIPQSFYYFYAYARLKDKDKKIVFSVPSGNFGNLTAGLIAKRMGLPVKQFVAATNSNDVVPVYLQRGVFSALPSHTTLSNAMDVGNPSNFQRLMDLYDGDLERLSEDVKGYSFSDDDTRRAMKDLASKGYVADPHGAVGYLGLERYLKEDRENTTGIFLETAHPGKFQEVVENVLQRKIELPDRLAKFMNAKKKKIQLPNDFNRFKEFLILNS